MKILFFIPREADRYSAFLRRLFSLVPLVIFVLLLWPTDHLAALEDAKAIRFGGKVNSAPGRVTRGRRQRYLAPLSTAWAAASRAMGTR